MEKKNLFKIIKKVSIFKNLSSENVEKILENIKSQIKTYKKNEFVFFRGETSNSVIILLEGEIRGEMQKNDGSIITIDYMNTSQVIAPAFIFGDDHSFPVDLVCTAESRFLFLNKKDFLETMQKNETVLINFLNEISNKGQLLTKRIWFNFLNRKISEKIISYIKKYRKGDLISFKPSISELAKKFEVTRPSLSREISILCEKGILSKIKGNQYRILKEL